MVAISLYRGNLHRVPDVPRRWLMPTRQISLKDFKSLLSRRTKALSRLPSSAVTAVATTSYYISNPNPTLNASTGDNNTILVASPLELEKGTNREKEGASKEVKDHDDLSNSEKPHIPEKGDAAVNHSGENLQVEKQDLEDNRNTETTCKTDLAVNDQEKRQNEVEEKLQVLNQKKHSLVQVLKQILNVEEELKRRNIAQGIASAPLQVDVTNDSVSMSRHATPRMGSEANLGGDMMEGGEIEDVPNVNMNNNNNNYNHSRHVKRMSSTSPSSESPLRKPPFIQHNVVPYPSRPSLRTTSSPSRFAPTGHQGPPANVLPPVSVSVSVSVSGTNYIASSPSPAASGGTSAFRDARQPSPWNEKQCTNMI
eukprot:XP_002511488.2 uncharacterized protein LOC8258148 isoform X1 [Ricinus communis]